MSETATSVDRRLAAILAVDLVGYSRLMSVDEEGTLARLRAVRSGFIDAVIVGHKGRIVKLMGDGALVEFASVVDAVRCAVEVQRGMAKRESDLPVDQRLRFRVGINLGDVIIEGDDIYGDGVNLASRLEGLADPGGICISRQAFDQIDGKFDLRCQSMGSQQVKNIDRPVEVFRVLLNRPKDTVRTANDGRAWSTKFALAGGVAAFLIIAAGFGFWRPWQPALEAASIERMAHPLPDKPSIAVLPFVNMSSDPEQEYFVDGLTEDLITDLSKRPELFVIARNTAFSYKGQLPPAWQVSEDLGVRYVLQGSARRVGEQVRVNAQLIDATAGTTLWADRADRPTLEIFDVQDEFVQSVLEGLNVETIGEEAATQSHGQTSNIDARIAFQRGWESLNRFSASENALAVEHLRRAVELDPNYGRAYAALGRAYFTAAEMYWFKELGLNRGQAALLGRKAREMAKQYNIPMVHTMQARSHLLDNEPAEGFDEATLAITQDPNDPLANHAMADALIANEKPHAALSFIEKAIRLDPHFENYYLFSAALSYFQMKKVERSIEILEKVVQSEGYSSKSWMLLAASYAWNGQRGRAHEAILRWLTERDNETLVDVVSEIPVYYWPGNTSLRARLRDGALLAALPTNTTVVTLTSRLYQGDESDRASAARSLGWLGSNGTEAVQALIDALDDPASVVAKEAAIALGKIGADASLALPALKAISAPPLVVKHAREAIDRITAD